MRSALRFAVLVGAVASVGSVAASENTRTLVALSGDDTLIRINAGNATVLGSTQVEGGERLFSIDVRGSSNRLYGLFTDGSISVIHPTTGARSNTVQLDHEFTAGRYNIDFDPTTERLRIIGANGENLRADVETGVVEEDLTITGPSPNPLGVEEVIIVAAAYTNGLGGPATQLYGIDRGTDALYLHVPPNQGTLSAVGYVGHFFSLQTFGFDIYTGPNGGNRARMVARDNLLTIDVGGGAILDNKEIRGLNTVVRDLTTLYPANLFP